MLHTKNKYKLLYQNFLSRLFFAIPSNVRHFFKSKLLPSNLSNNMSSNMLSKTSGMSSRDSNVSIFSNDGLVTTLHHIIEYLSVNIAKGFNMLILMFTQYTIIFTDQSKKRFACNCRSFFLMRSRTFFPGTIFAYMVFDTIEY